MELLSSAAIALASSWEGEAEPFDLAASGVLSGARLLVAGDDPVATDALVGHLRAHGAAVGVTDARGRGLDRLGFLDAQALFYDPRRAREDVLHAALDDCPRLRGAKLVPFYWDDVWPAGAVRPNLELLALAVRSELALDRELRHMAEARRSFPVPFARLGPARVLRALAGANGSVLRVVIASDDVRAVVELGGDLVVSATTYGTGPTPLRVGVRALADLLALRRGRGHVERHDLARVMTIMAPVPEALAVAEPHVRRLHDGSVETTLEHSLETFARAAVDEPEPKWEDETTKKTLTSMPPEAYPDDGFAGEGITAGEDTRSEAATWDSAPTPARPEPRWPSPVPPAPTDVRAPVAIPRPKPAVPRSSAVPDVEPPDVEPSPRLPRDDDTTARRVVETPPPLAPTWLPVALARAKAPPRAAEPARPSTAAPRPTVAARPAPPPAPASATSTPRAAAPPSAPPSTPAPPRASVPPEASAPSARRAAHGASPAPKLVPSRAVADRESVEARLSDPGGSSVGSGPVAAPRSFEPLAPRPSSFPAVDVSSESRGPLWWSLGLAVAAAVAVGWLVATHDMTGATSVLRASFGESGDARPPVPDVTPAPLVGSAGLELAAPSGLSGIASRAVTDTGAVTDTDAVIDTDAADTDATDTDSVIDTAAVTDTNAVIDPDAVIGTDAADTDSVTDTGAADTDTAGAVHAADPDHVDDDPVAAASSRSTTVHDTSAEAAERFTPGDVWSSPSRDRERSDALLAQALATEGSERRELFFEAALAHPGNPHVAFHLAREAQAQGDLELAELWARHAIRLRRRRDEYRTLLAEILRAAGD